jgi:hypothetical protein
MGDHGLWLAHGAHPAVVPSLGSPSLKHQPTGRGYALSLSVAATGVCPHEPEAAQVLLCDRSAQLEIL